jgi:hypothetical protein
MASWEWKSRDSDYSSSVGSPRTPLPRTDVLGKYIMIQPRSVDADFRDKRMLYFPLPRSILIEVCQLQKNAREIINMVNRGRSAALGAKKESVRFEPPGL